MALDLVVPDKETLDRFPTEPGESEYVTMLAIASQR